MPDFITTSIVAVLITILTAWVGVFLLDKQLGPDRRGRATEIVTGTVKAVTQPFVRSRQEKSTAKLILIDSAGIPGLQTVIQLHENTTVRIGRDPDLVNVALNDRRVSRLHCRINDGPNGFLIWDEGSASGTYVNDEDVKMHGSLLKAGDILNIGPIGYRFEVDSPSDAVSTDTEPYQRTQKAIASNG